MIQVSLIEDNTHWEKEQLQEMESEFRRNFMQQEDNLPEGSHQPGSPEMRIYVKMQKSALPEILLKALGEDLCDSISDGFLDAFSRPKTGETPSLVFHFAGELRSFEFQVSSNNNETLRNASSGVISKLIEHLNSEETPSQSSSIQTFHYSDGSWISS